MTHTDKFKTPPANENYRENYNKIDWNKPKCEFCGIELDKQAIDAGYGSCESCYMAWYEQIRADERERDYLNNLYNDDGFAKW